MTAEEHIDEIMDNFDFRKVAFAMEAVDWHWATCEGVPSESELRKVARHYLKEVAKHDSYWSTGSGGFMATRYDDGNLGLVFQMSDWNTEYEEEDQE